MNGREHPVENNGQVAISFTLINPELEYITRKLFIEAISEELDDVDVSVFNGTLRTNIADDS